MHLVVLGDLHIEMALWNILGDVLEWPGWTSALTESELACGIDDSFLKVSHLTQTRHTHQFTLLTLQKLQKEALLQSRSNKSESAWRNDMQTKSLTFMYWDLILWYEILIQIFIRTFKSIISSQIGSHFI